MKFFCTSSLKNGKEISPQKHTSKFEPTKLLRALLSSESERKFFLCLSNKRAHHICSHAHAEYDYCGDGCQPCKGECMLLGIAASIHDNTAHCFSCLYQVQNSMQAL